MTDAKFRFFEARRKANIEDWVARLTRKDDDLLPYEEVAQILQAYQQIPNDRPRMIPLAKIVGSVGRYRDFTRSFLPREGVKAERWVRIDEAISGLVGVPPIEVYQIGDVYFVADGNHRVSVARANGFAEIEAYVTEIAADVDLESGDSLDEAIIKLECSRFVAETGLGKQCNDLDIAFTRPGGFTHLLQHIEVHRYFMTLDHPDCAEPTYEQAALDWYEFVYLPIVTAIRQHDLLSHFPGRTAADLYMWVSERILELHQAYGETVSPDAAVEMLKRETPTPFLGVVRHIIDRLAELAGEMIGQGGAAPEPATAPVVVPPATAIPGKEPGGP